LARKTLNREGCQAIAYRRLKQTVKSPVDDFTYPHPGPHQQHKPGQVSGRVGPRPHSLDILILEIAGQQVLSMDKNSL